MSSVKSPAAAVPTISPIIRAAISAARAICLLTLTSSFALAQSAATPTAEPGAPAGGPPPVAPAAEPPSADQLPALTVEATTKKKIAPAVEATPAPATVQSRAAPAASLAPAPAAETDAAAGPAIPGPNAKGDVGYLATRGTAATKTDTPLRNVPQSISVITEQQIKDQSFQNIGDVSRYVPGVILHQGEGNRDQLSIRGQVASTADFFVNGVRDDAQVFRDLYNTERIEFLKGPAALVFGRGGAGGIVNRVTKEADFRPTFTEATVEFGSFMHKRLVADTGTPISSTVAFRVVGMAEDSGSYRDFTDLQRWAVNPTLAFKLTDNTKVIFGYEHAYDHRTADRGIPSVRLPGAVYGVPVTVDRSTSFGNPDLSFAEAVVNRVYATIEHKTDFGLSIRNHTSWVGYDKFYQNVYPGTSLNTPGAGLVGLQAYNNETDRENLFNQTDLTYKLDMGWMRHTLLLGAEFGHQISDNWRHNGTFGPGNGQCVSFTLANGSATGQCNVVFSNPTIFSPNVTFAATQTRNHVEADVRSFYVQDQVQLTRYLELIGGVRHDTFDLEFTNRGPATATLPAGVVLNQKDNLISPRAGVVLKPTDNLSIYGSYSVSYLPASGDQFSGVASNTLTLEPEKYINYEIGLKWDIARALAFTAAAYRTDRENVRFATSATDFVQTGKTQVEGIELTLAGYVTDQWQISAGYSHIFKGELLTSTAASATTIIPAGTPLPLLPQDTVSLWNKYQFTPTFGAGIGVVYHSDNFATLQPISNRVLLPAYTTVDAALFLTLDANWSAQLNVTNIFNEEFILSADSNDNLTPGAPRSAIVSVTAKF